MSLVERLKYMDDSEQDLAKGMFFEKWPAWLRWLLFIPASIFAPLLFVIIQTVINTWFLDLGENAFYFNLLRGVAYGVGIVVVGAMVAPKRQKVVAMFLLIVIAMIGGVAIFYQLSNFVLNEFLEDLITIVSAGCATYYLINEINKEEAIHKIL